MSGMRFGVIHTHNKKAIDSIKMFTYFHMIPVYIQRLLTLLLSDTDWLNGVFFPTSSRRLREAHRATTEALDEMGVPYLNRPSGLYIYADFRKVIHSAQFHSCFKPALASRNTHSTRFLNLLGLPRVLRHVPTRLDNPPSTQVDLTQPNSTSPLQ